MRQLIGKRVGETTPRSHCKGQKEAAPADSDMGRTGDLLMSIEDALSEADKSLVRAASNQEALSVDIGLLATDLKEVSPLCHTVHIKALIFYHRKRVLLRSLVWSSKVLNANVS